MPRPVGELAVALRITQPRVSKHLRVLREVGLVRVREVGRGRRYSLDARGLAPIHEWVGGFERFWNEAFGRLDAYVQELRGSDETQRDPSLRYREGIPRALYALWRTVKCAVLGK
jgi:DNA-binding transcriptional ArsR family regulator